jgi:hypothetical protein
VFLHGSWDLEAQGFSALDPEIVSLAAKMRAGAAASRAASTFSTYSGPWAKFKEWCLSKGVSYLPAAPLTVSLYLTKLMRTAQSPSPVLSCSGAIYLHHQLAGFPSPTQHPLVAMSREVARRSKVGGQNVKKPLLASHIRRLFELWRYGPQSSLHDLMRLTAIVLTYVGFLRFSDVMIIQWEEIRFFESHMEFFLEKTKTDQYREGRLFCARASADVSARSRWSSTCLVLVVMLCWGLGP